MSEDRDSASRSKTSDLADGPHAGSSRTVAVMPPWEHLVALALQVAVGLLVFWPVFDPSQRDLSGKFDVFRQFGPWNYFFDRALASGEFPLWNPLVLNGMPHAANPQTWAFYPPNLLRALLQSAPTPAGTLSGLAILVGLHIVLLGQGTRLVARRHGISRLGSLTSMLVVSFAALTVRRAAEFHFLFTLAWLPWMLLALDGCLAQSRVRTRLAWTMSLALFCGLALLGGFPQIYPHLAIAALAHVVVARANQRSRLDARNDGTVLGLLVLAGALGVAMAAPMWLPAHELLELSPRASGSDVDVAGQLPEAWSASYVWRSLVVYPGRVYEPETVRGAGALALILLLVGSLARARAAPLPFLIATVVLIDLVLGQPMPLSTAVNYLTPFQLVSATRATDVALVPIAVLVGFGFDALCAARSRGRRWLFTLTGLCCAAVLPTLYRGLPEVEWLRVPRSILPLCLAGAAIALLLAWPWPERIARLRSPAGLLLACLLAAELVSWNQSYARALLLEPGYDRRWQREGYDGSEAFWADNQRGAIDRFNFHLFGLQPAFNGYDPLSIGRVREVLVGRGQPYRRAVWESEVPQSNARGHLFLKRSLWLLPAVVRGPLPPPRVIYPAASVAHVEPEQQVPEGIQVLSAEQVRDRPGLGQLHTLKLPQPKIRTRPRGRSPQRIFEWAQLRMPASHSVLELTLSGQGPIAAYPFTQAPGQSRWHAALRREARLTRGRTTRVRMPLPDAERLALRIEVTYPVNGTAPSLVAARVLSDPADEDGRIEITQRTPNGLEASVRELPGPRLLFFVDADYPGWNAEVDGRPVPIVRVNQAFKGVWLTAGDHRVRFRFHSTRLPAALTLAGLALLGTLLTLVWALRGTPSRRSRLRAR